MKAWSPPPRPLQSTAAKPMSRGIRGRRSDVANKSGSDHHLVSIAPYQKILGTSIDRTLNASYRDAMRRHRTMDSGQTRNGFSLAWACKASSDGTREFDTSTARSCAPNFSMFEPPNQGGHDDLHLERSEPMRNVKRARTRGTAPLAYFTAGQRVTEVYGAADDKSSPSDPTRLPK